MSKEYKPHRLGNFFSDIKFELGYRNYRFLSFMADIREKMDTSLERLKSLRRGRLEQPQNQEAKSQRR